MRLRWPLGRGPETWRPDCEPQSRGQRVRSTKHSSPSGWGSPTGLGNSGGHSEAQREPVIAAVQGLDDRFGARVSQPRFQHASAGVSPHRSGAGTHLDGTTCTCCGQSPITQNPDLYAASSGRLVTACQSGSLAGMRSRFSSSHLFGSAGASQNLKPCSLATRIGRSPRSPGQARPDPLGYVMARGDSERVDARTVPYELIRTHLLWPMRVIYHASGPASPSRLEPDGVGA
jgi:hypothetical protein